MLMVRLIRRHLSIAGQAVLALALAQATAELSKVYQFTAADLGVIEHLSERRHQT
jgi:hypothetical protein